MNSLLLLLALAAPRHGMAVAVSPPGADAGREILRKGGNAVDAAVAMAFAMAVTYPSAGNLGGGGFMVVHPAKGEPMVVEYREKAPLAARRTMFTKKDSIYSCKAAGVPGTVAGMWLAHKTYGKLPWRDVLAPALRLARGFKVDASLASSLNWATGGAAPTPEIRRVLGKVGGWSEGDTLAQPDLKATLERIRDQGAEGFYKGRTADLIAREMKAGGGLITLEDLAAYKANLRKPVHGTYRGHDVYAPPPPSSGGICLVQMLNTLENFDLKKNGRFAPLTLHRMAETMKRAYADRARHLGDGDFVKIPAHLTSKEYGRKLALSITGKATPSATLAPDIELAREGDSTTHFSVIDGDGMAVANTYTLERSYGSRIVVRGAGFLLNNEMMDFNWFPGETTREGGIGTEPNTIRPGKRMLSSQTPTIVARGGKVFLVTGSPGSRTIINTSLCIVVNAIDFGMTARQAVDAPRLHHQWFPDELRFEGLQEHPEAADDLRKRGHDVAGGSQGDAHTIRVNPKTGEYEGAADRRINGKAAGF
ncbi:MAG: gamma-glutamyltransferase [Gemmataceae bacterium]|nr:gamma-glutamyltransferase [Gemmataceae bacterium]